MKVTILPLNQITPYARNPRKNAAAVATVKASLKEYGWQQPIVIDRERVIVAGHTRYLAAMELGWKEAPVKYADDLTPAQVKAYRLMDNKSHERAEWDNELLALELEDLKALELDLELTGFTDEELARQALLDDYKGSQSVTNYEFTPRIEPKIDSKSYNDSDINKTEDQLENKYKDGKKYLDVVCPYCYKEFSLDR